MWFQLHQSIAVTHFAMLQVDVLAQHEHGVATINLPEDIRSQALMEWQATQMRFNITKLVRDLCAVLEALNIPFQTGVMEARGLLRIDIALTDQQVCSSPLKS